MATLGYSIERVSPQQNDIHPFWAQFDGIVFINTCDQHTVELFLERHGISAYIFSFLQNSGSRGASRFRRHQLVLKFAIAHEWKNVVVLEENLELVGPYIAQSQYDAITSFVQNSEFGELNDVLSLTDTFTNRGRKVQAGIHESTNKIREFVHPYYETCPGAYIASRKFMQHLAAETSEPNDLHQFFMNSSRVRFVSPALFYQSMIDEQFKGPFIFKKLWYRKQRLTSRGRVVLQLLVFLAFLFFFMFLLSKI